MIILNTGNVKLKELYEDEIIKIKNVLYELENGLIYLPDVFTNDKSNGELHNKVKYLRTQLNDLFSKIENDKNSESEKLNDLF